MFQKLQMNGTTELNLKIFSTTFSMVFCYGNCFVLLREKNVVMVGKNFCNFESEGNLLEQCIRIGTREQLKCQKIIGV